MPYDAETFKVPAENFLNFLKFRRSTRQYQQKTVEQEKLERVVEAGRYTPTASNGQNVHFVVVQEQMERVKDLIWEGLERMLEAREIPHYRGMLQRFIDRRKADKTQDALFFGAPVLVVLTCEGPWNGPLAARSMELMAEAEGLGSLYSGFIPERDFLQPGSTGTSRHHRRTGNGLYAHWLSCCEISPYGSSQKSQCYLEIRNQKDCRILTVFFLCHSADVTSFACLFFYNKDRREQCGTLHRCGVFGQWYLFLSGSVDCRKDFVQKVSLVAAHFGRICSITVFCLLLVFGIKAGFVLSAVMMIMGLEIAYFPKSFYGFFQLLVALGVASFLLGGFLEMLLPLRMPNGFWGKG